MCTDKCPQGDGGHPEGGQLEGGGPRDADLDAHLDAGGCTLHSTDAGTAGTLNWAEAFGKTGTAAPQSIAVDPTTGDVVVVGNLTGSADFGGGLVTNAGDAAVVTGAFVAKFDSGGHYEWAKAFDNGKDITPTGIAIDASGNVAFAGTFDGSVNFGGGSVAALGNLGVFVVELDSTGAFRWAKSFGSPGTSQSFVFIAPGEAGAIVLTGLGASVDFGGGPLSGGYLAEVDNAGAFKWGRALSDSANPFGLAVDAAGNIVLAGGFSGTIDFGNGATLTTPAANVDAGDPTSQAFAARFDPTGTYQWGHAYGVGAGGLGSVVYQAAVDGCGNVFLTGTFSGSIDFGPGPLSGPANAFFLAKLDPSGAGVWSDSFGATTALNGAFSSVAVAGSGEPILTSQLVGTVDFGGGMLSSTNGGMAIVGLDTAGHYRWGTMADDSVPALWLSAAGGGSSVAVTGNFGPGNLTLAGKSLMTPAHGFFTASFVP